MTGSTISTTLAKEIVVGSTGSVYLSPLTITSAGRINGPAPDTSFQAAAAIYAGVIGGGITNFGLVSGAVPASDSYTAPAILSVNDLTLSNFGTITGQSGIYLQDAGTVTNSGSIAGLEALGNSGYGVRLVNAELANSGVVYGRRYGVANLDSSEVINSGIITGETAGIKLVPAGLAAGGTLSNTGTISGLVAGVTETSALIGNAGTITGETYGIRIAWGGSVTNSGLISAGTDGVLLLNEQYQAKYAAGFMNSGTVEGGYFGVAINFAGVTNAGSGLISGNIFGAGVGNSGYLYNAGTIYAVTGALLTESGGRAVNAGTVRANRTGVELFSGSILTNASTGYVYTPGTAALNQGGYLVNAGTMAGEIYGLEILSGGIAINSGSILSSIDEGVYLSTLSATSSPDFLVNNGYIYGRGLGLSLKNGTAYSYGRIDAQQIAVSLVTGTSFNNSGDAYGKRYGVQLAGGTLVNSGSIGGNVNGVEMTHGYFTNSGTVTGVKNAVYGTSFSLTIDPGAVFKGNVTDKTKTSRLNLAGDTPGTLSGIGTQFNAFGTIDFEPGAQWLISGTTAALAAKQAINGFEHGDTIIVTGFSTTSDSFVSGRGLILHTGSTSETLDITGSFVTANFSVTGSGTLTTISLQANAPCFTAGTRILTPQGERAIEDLAVGDRVITQSGEDRPIIWIGVRTIDLRLHPRPGEVQPVCIAANALAEDVPRRDLFVSPDHALLIDDVLIPAQLLLNGLNITQGALPRVTYYHLELDAHAVIFAENAPAESYLETGNRHAFENAGGAMMLHPDFSAMIRREKSCAELLLNGGNKLEQIRRRSMARHTPGRQPSRPDTARLTESGEQRQTRSMCDEWRDLTERADGPGGGSADISCRRFAPASVPFVPSTAVFRFSSGKAVRHPDEGVDLLR